MAAARPFGPPPTTMASSEAPTPQAYGVWRASPPSGRRPRLLAVERDLDERRGGHHPLAVVAPAGGDRREEPLALVAVEDHPAVRRQVRLGAGP